MTRRRIGTAAFLSMFALLNGREARAGWHPGNLEKIRKYLSEPRTGAERPAALFDCDNTLIKNDIGDATLFWMLAHGRILAPASWEKTSGCLSAPAVEALNRQCAKNITKAGCTDTILSVYDDRLPNGAPAWKKDCKNDTMEPAYAWAAQLMAGRTPAEIRAYGREALDFNINNPIGAVQTVGSQRKTAYIRVYPEMAELVSAVRKQGIDPWIVSASSQYVVEAVAEKFGIPADHVIGIRPALDKNGKITPGLEGCGPYPDGNQNLIPYRQGKRCWINKVVWKMSDPDRMMRLPAESFMAAGDSDTDVFFLKDSPGLKIVINRNKPELMCNAYNNSGGNWIVNPMFVLPLPERKGGYRCGPFNLPDQPDRIHGPENS